MYKMAERKYTLNVEGSDMQLKREFEFHSPQFLTVYDAVNDFDSVAISKFNIYAISPNFSSPGKLQVNFSLGGESEKHQGFYDIGEPYDCVSDLKSDLSKLEAEILTHFLEDKKLTFKGVKGVASALEFESAFKKEKE
jgi:hypothetical protein